MGRIATPEVKSTFKARFSEGSGLGASGRILSADRLLRALPVSKGSVIFDSAKGSLLLVQQTMAKVSHSLHLSCASCIALRRQNESIWLETIPCDCHTFLDLKGPEVTGAAGTPGVTCGPLFSALSGRQWLPGKPRKVYEKLTPNQRSAVTNFGFSAAVSRGFCSFVPLTCLLRRLNHLKP